jgi:hypothetical protein
MSLTIHAGASALAYDDLRAVQTPEVHDICPRWNYTLGPRSVKGHAACDLF